MARVNLALLKDAIETLGLSLATHHHVWTAHERRLWERAWVEIRRHQSDNPDDPPIPDHAVIRKPGVPDARRTV